MCPRSIQRHMYILNIFAFSERHLRTEKKWVSTISFSKFLKRNEKRLKENANLTVILHFHDTYFPLKKHLQLSDF